MDVSEIDADDDAVAAVNEACERALEHENAIARPRDASSTNDGGDARGLFDEIALLIRRTLSTAGPDSAISPDLRAILRIAERGSRLGGVGTPRTDADVSGR